jgi:hypothetical protein
MGEATSWPGTRTRRHRGAGPADEEGSGAADVLVAVAGGTAKVRSLMPGLACSVGLNLLSPRNKKASGYNLVVSRLARDVVVARQLNYERRHA